MRLDDKGKVLAHSMLVGLTPHDHHPQGTLFTVVINSQAIAAGTDYSHRVALGRSGHQTIRGFLRGAGSARIQGHTGSWVCGGPAAGQSMALSSAYMGAYTYMGAFSRLHGDSYLSWTTFWGGNGIVLKDCYIDGSDAVIVWRNTNTTSQNLTAYGTMVCK